MRTKTPDKKKHMTNIIVGIPNSPENCHAYFEIITKNDC